MASATYAGWRSTAASNILARCSSGTVAMASLIFLRIASCPLAIPALTGMVYEKPLPSGNWMATRSGLERRMPLVPSVL
jgi:hypothetical protein